MLGQLDQEPLQLTSVEPDTVTPALLDAHRRKLSLVHGRLAQRTQQAIARIVAVVQQHRGRLVGNATGREVLGEVA